MSEGEENSGRGRDSHDKDGNGENRRDSRDRDRDRERRRRRSRSDSRERSSRKSRRRSRSSDRHRSRRYREESRERGRGSGSGRRSSRSRSRSRSRGHDRSRKSHSPEATTLSSSSNTSKRNEYSMAPASTTGPGGPNTMGGMGGPPMNPTAIAMAAARSLGVPLSMPVHPQAGGGMPGAMGIGPGTNPQMMAQLMRSQQGGAGFGMPSMGGVPGMMTGMGMGMGDKTVRELFVGNTPQGTSDFVLLEFLNAAMKQVNLCSQPGNPVLSCRVNNKYAFVELRSAEETTKALNINGIPFMGQMLKIGRPSKYQGPMTPSSTWQKLTGQVGASEVVDPSTKVFRELYVGNTSPEMNDVLLKDFLGNTMQQVGMTLKPGSPIIHTRVSGNFAFVECRSIEEATNLLSLNGIPFLGQELKINRPSKYPGPETPHLNWPDVLARYTSGNPNAPIPAPATIFRPASMTMVGGMMTTAPGTTAAALAAAAAVEALVPAARPTKVLRLNNMLTSEDLEDEDGLEDIEEETKEECEKFGTVTSVVVPRPSTKVESEMPGVGYVFVAFDGVDGSAGAAASLRGRTFDGRKVEVTYWDEDMYNQRVFSDKGNAEVTSAAATAQAAINGNVAAALPITSTVSGIGGGTLNAGAIAEASAEPVPGNSGGEVAQLGEEPVANSGVENGNGESIDDTGADSTGGD